MATVMLDAGHGGYDNGAMFNGRKEKDDNLNLTLAVGNILENNGIDVLYTRTTDVYQSPNEKARIANDSDADYFVSFHRNSSPEPDTYSGVQTLVYENEGIPAVLAENINVELEKVGFENLGVEERKNLAVLRGTNMPAVLVEVGFINTRNDNNLFDLKFPEIAQGIADGIYTSVTGAAASDDGMRSLSVETGVFKHYENAKALAENMQMDGFSCYIQPQNQYYSVCHGNFSDFDDAARAQKEIFAAGYETRIVNRVKN